MQVPIDDIIVKKRIRREIGNIESLAESMRRLGQISPISITKNNVLLAGGRRLEAARSLGWRTINAVIVEIQDEAARLEYEIEENVQRQDFSPEEISEASVKLNKLRNPGFFLRIALAVRNFFRKLFGIEE